MCEHAYDFLADWVQHIPRARQHVVTYAGWFANALGKLNPKKDNETNTVEELAEKPTGKWVKWPRATICYHLLYDGQSRPSGMWVELGAALGWEKDCLLLTPRREALPPSLRPGRSEPGSGAGCPLTPCS